MMSATPTAPTRTTHARAATTVASLLRARILDGEFVPGQRLIEADLLDELDVGRSTLREALLQLDADGLVELRHQRGAAVTKLSAQDLADLFGVRERLEGYAACLAAQRINLPGNREWLLSQQEHWQRDEMLTNERRHMEDNVPLHEGIIRMGGNERLVAMLQRLQIPAYRQRFGELLTEQHRRDSVSEHQQIIAALLAGEADKAERAMRRHVRHTGKLALKILA